CNGELSGETLHHRRRRARNRLGQVEAIQLLRLAEVRRVEELLQADDLGALARGLAHQALSPRDVGVAVVAGAVLDDSDGERCVGHGFRLRITVYGLEWWIQS